MNIFSILPKDSGWEAYCLHLDRVGDAKWVLEPKGAPLPQVHFSGAAVDGKLIGNLTLKVQPMIIPATSFSEGKETPMVGEDNQPLKEAFVQTFTVEAEYRRRGIGRALQLRALKLAEELGCCQMRSWSSVDKHANYSLKINLGFGIHPAVSETSSGMLVSGVYFVKRV